jgi:hypothetical protein
MSLILSGTDGLSDVDGSAATPAIRGTDANTGMFFPAADTIAFSEGGVESMRIASNGNVGIGTNNPVLGLLDINGASSTLTVRTPDTTSPTLALFVNAGSNGVGTVSVDNGGIMTFDTGSTGAGQAERMRIDSSGNVGIGTSSPASRLNILAASAESFRISYDATKSARLGATSAGDLQVYAFDGSNYRNILLAVDGSTSAGNVGIGTSSPTQQLNFTGNALTSGWYRGGAGTAANPTFTVDGNTGMYRASSGDIAFSTSNAERMRIDSSGNVMVAKTTLGSSSVGCEMRASGLGVFTASAPASGVVIVNRETDDGTLIDFRQGNTLEGTITVSGTTVSYNGGHLSRWSQLPDGSKDDTILKGTILSNLDDMCVWTKDGEQLPNEQLNKMKVSDVEGDTNVAGVFVNWTRDEDCNSDDMNIAMTGDMIIRIADGVVVQKGDLLMSAGDGTAMPQGDDIVRSKTVAKVTSNYVTCTYADGSYCVPCVLMAC